MGGYGIVAAKVDKETTEAIFTAGVSPRRTVLNVRGDFSRRKWPER